MRNWLFYGAIGFGALFSSGLPADIGLIYADNTRATIFYDKASGKVVHYLCQSTATRDQLTRHCPRIDNDPFSLPFASYVSNVQEFLRLDKRYRGIGAVVDIAKDVEELKRESADPLPGTNPARAIAKMEELIALQRRFGYPDETIFQKLSFGATTNVVYTQGIVGPVLTAFYGLHTIWWDGGSKLWRVGPKATFSAQRSVCNQPWRTADQSDYFNIINKQENGNRYEFERLADTSIGKAIGSGWSLWTRGSLKPYQYSVGSYSKDAPTLGQAVRLAKLSQADYPRSDYYVKGDRGVFYELLAMQTSLNVLCVTDKALDENGETK